MWSLSGSNYSSVNDKDEAEQLQWPKAGNRKQSNRKLGASIWKSLAVLQLIALGNSLEMDFIGPLIA